MLFGKKKNRELEAADSSRDTRTSFGGGAENPFLKPGDIIRLRSRAGKYQVMLTDHDGFSVHQYPVKNRNASPIRCAWEDFKHWSRQ